MWPPQYLHEAKELRSLNPNRQQHTTFVTLRLRQEQGIK